MTDQVTSRDKKTAVARERVINRQLEVTPEGPMSKDEEHYLKVLDLCLERMDQGKFDIRRQCPRCAIDSLDWDEVDIGVGVMNGPASCIGCGWHADDK